MYDVVILGGMIADGSGAPMYRADVAVQAGRIAAIGDLAGAAAKKTLDASGMIVAPGFIDSHAHSDTSFLKDSVEALSGHYDGDQRSMRHESLPAAARAGGGAVELRLICGVCLPF